MEPKPFPIIPYECPGGCPRPVHEATTLLLNAAINLETGVMLSVILKRAGIPEQRWWDEIRSLVANHFPSHEIVDVRTGLKGERPLTLIPKKDV